MEATIINALRVRTARQNLHVAHALRAVRHLLYVEPSGLPSDELYRRGAGVKVFLPRLVLNTRSGKVCSALAVDSEKKDSYDPAVFFEKQTPDQRKPRDLAQGASPVLLLSVEVLRLHLFRAK